MNTRKRKVKIVEATEEHATELIENMNRECRLECAAFGIEPAKAVWEAYRKSDQPYTGLSDGRVGAIFGIVPFTMLGSAGRPWMLSTAVASKEWLYTARASKKYILWALQHKYQRLENVVDYRYKLSIRWLEWLGFTIEEPQQHWLTGKLVCKFYKER